MSESEPAAQKPRSPAYRYGMLVLFGACLAALAAIWAKDPKNFGENRTGYAAVFLAFIAQHLQQQFTLPKAVYATLTVLSWLMVTVIVFLLFRWLIH